MVEQDTIKLLRECDAGIKMGISAIDETIDYVKSDRFKSCLNDSKAEHKKIKSEIQELLVNYEDNGKNPNPIAKSMSWVKTNVMLAVNESDATIADLITDGCNTGVKTLHRYLNEYEGADEKSKNLTKRLINIEERLAVDIRTYL